MGTPSLIKQPSESRLFAMEFAPLLGSGETISSVSSVTAAPSGLTISDPPTFAGTRAAQRISGGVDGTRYKVTIIVVTSAGNILEGEGYLQVKDL